MNPPPPYTKIRVTPFVKWSDVLADVPGIDSALYE